MKAFEADVPHPEIVWAEPAVPPPPAPVPAPMAQPVPVPTPMPTAPPPAYAPPLPQSRPPAAPAPAAAVNGTAHEASDGTPDPVDMVNWTDADWNAWLAAKQAETGSGA
jgi:protein TonB